MRFLIVVMVFYLIAIIAACFCRWLEDRSQWAGRRFCPRCGHKMPMCGQVEPNEARNA